MPFNFRIDQRSTYLSDSRLWKLFRSSERLHGSNSTKRRWMISLPVMLWGCIGSLDMLVYEIKSPTSSQEAVLLWSLLDLGRPWKSLGRINGLNVGWLSSIGYGGEVLVIPKDRLGTLSGCQGYVCPLTGHNPGLLLAFLLDIIPWEDIFPEWGCQTVHCVGVEQRMKPRPTFFVNVKLWLHSHTCIWAPFWSHRASRV